MDAAAKDRAGTRQVVCRGMYLRYMELYITRTVLYGTTESVCECYGATEIIVIIIIVVIIIIIILF